MTVQFVMDETREFKAFPVIIDYALERGILKDWEWTGEFGCESLFFTTDKNTVSRGILIDKSNIDLILGCVDAIYNLNPSRTYWANTLADLENWKEENGQS